MKILISAKHWQLFVFLVGVMFLPTFLPDESSPYLPKILNLLLMIGLMGWVWTVGNTCNSKLPTELKKSSLPMTISIIYAGTYFIFLTFIFGKIGGIKMTYLAPFHFAAMIGMFYSLGYTARRLVTLQKREVVNFFEYSGPFFMFWFFPIGVWFIQPKVNDLLGNKSV